MRMDGEMGDEDGDGEVEETKKARWHSGKFFSIIFLFLYLTGF